MYIDSNIIKKQKTIRQIRTDVFKAQNPMTGISTTVKITSTSEDNATTSYRVGIKRGQLSELSIDNLVDWDIALLTRALTEVTRE